ncbi:hypothetical protein ACFX2I_006855 [Malus domestica]
MFEEVKPSTKATAKRECKGLADVDHDSETTLSLKGKGRAKTGYQASVAIHFQLSNYEFVPRRKFDEFAQLMEVWLRTILEELEAERGAQRAWFPRKSPKDTKLKKSPTPPQDHDMGYKDLTALSSQPYTSIPEQKLTQEKTQSY